MSNWNKPCINKSHGHKAKKTTTSKIQKEVMFSIAGYKYKITTILETNCCFCDAVHTRVIDTSYAKTDAEAEKLLH